MEISKELEETVRKLTNSNPMPKIPNIPFQMPRDYKLADFQYEIIKCRIREIENTLDNEHEIALQLASFGQSMVLAVTEIDYRNPQIMVFTGYVNGQKAELIQHVGQLNFLILVVKKEEPQRPARRIGFR